jgi:hypothetical protein
MTLEHTKTLMHILAPMESVETPQLRRVAAELRQRRGEYIACAQVIERAIQALRPEEGVEEPVPSLGIDEAYGDMTFPLGG